MSDQAQHIDQAQHGAVKLQSSAMVAAAFITTLGAITAACIQTGWINKPPAGTICADLTPMAQASFLGTIEPLGAKATSESAGIAPAVVAPEAPDHDAALQPNGDDVKAAPLPAQPWTAKTLSTETLRQTAMKHSPAPANVFQASAYRSETVPTLLETPQPISAPQSALAQQLPPSPASLAADPTPNMPLALPQLSQPQLPPATVATAAASPTTAEIKQTAAYAPASLPAATLLANDGAVKILPSPWSALTQPTAGDQPAAAAKSSKKLIDWGAVARIFQGHD